MDSCRCQCWRSDMAGTQGRHADFAVSPKTRQVTNVADVEPTLLHCDLVNRNVHVQDGVVTGVFDWGCRRWGDHLYDLAWFEFWSPWMPNLDTELLKSELVSRWGHAPDPDRLAACLLHIGADHLVYNAVKGDPGGGRALLDRLAALDLL